MPQLCASITIVSISSSPLADMTVHDCQKNNLNASRCELCCSTLKPGAVSSTSPAQGAIYDQDGSLNIVQLCRAVHPCTALPLQLLVPCRTGLEEESSESLSEPA